MAYSGKVPGPEPRHVLMTLLLPQTRLPVGWVREVRNATNKERYVCVRARVGERPVSLEHRSPLPMLERAK
jgi:hypothetical protein